jgi:hypothetical protein
MAMKQVPTATWQQLIDAATAAGAEAARLAAVNAQLVTKLDDAEEMLDQMTKRIAALTTTAAVAPVAATPTAITAAPIPSNKDGMNPAHYRRLLYEVYRAAMIMHGKTPKDEGLLGSSDAAIKEVMVDTKLFKK